MTENFDKVLQGENPLIDFTDTYAMHDYFVRLGCREYANGPWRFADIKYRVNHGINCHTGKIYITQNTLKTGQCVPHIEDLTY